MNIVEAIATGKPFYHSDMIGAFLIVDEYLVHRDNISDFDDMNWIRQNCIPNKLPRDSCGLLSTYDLIRVDWKTTKEDEEVGGYFYEEE